MGILPTSFSSDASLPTLKLAAGAGFLEASGERMAHFGPLDRSELWMWPYQVARQVQLEIRRAGETAPLSLAREIQVTPAGYRVGYTGEGLHLEHEIVASRTERALVHVISLESTREVQLELGLCLVPTLRAQWPAAVGGRIATVDETTGALLLTEELGRVAVFVGSPEAEPLEAGLDHGLAEEPVTLRIPFGSARARRGPLPIFVAGAVNEPAPLDEEARVGGADAARGFARSKAVVDAAREAWRELHTEWRELIEGQVRHARAFEARTSRLEGGEPAFARAFTWAKFAIERAWVRLDRLSGLDGLPVRGLVAGIGPSHGTERPGFAWYFNGDALCAARAQTAVGDFEGAHEVLRLAARTQREDGKLSHELSLSMDLCDWFGEFPYAYYKANQTPGFVNVAQHVLGASGDSDLGADLCGAVGKALDWGRRLVDERGLLPVPLAGIAAVEAGPLAGALAGEVYLQGIWCDALRSGVELLREHGTLSDELAEEARASQGIAPFWRPDLDRHGFAELRDGGRCDDRSGYLGLPLARGLDDPEHCLASAMELNHPSLMSDWGVRMFSRDAEVYDPEHYNTGSVFPYLTGFSVLAFYRHGLPMHGYQVLASQVALDGFDGPGFVPEYLTGDRASTARRAVPHQIFSSSTIVQGVAYGLLGIEQQVRGGEAELHIAPSLPPHWNELSYSGLAAGEARVDLSLRRQRGSEGSQLEIDLESPDPALPAPRVVVSPRFAPGSLPGKGTVDGNEVEVTWTLEPSGALRATFPDLRPPCHLQLEVREGPLLRLPAGPVERDSGSVHPRLVRATASEQRIEWQLWGLAGSTAHLEFWCERGVHVDGALLEENRLVVPFPPRPTGPPDTDHEVFCMTPVTLELR